MKIDDVKNLPPVLRRLEDLPELLTRDELAEFTGVPKQTLARWSSEGLGPRITRLVGHVRYRKADVIDFIKGDAA